MSGVINDISSAPQTFSSWDNCMAKSYCKYPAIVGIIIASLIVLSFVWCIASCLCCGATLCGSCIRCLTCFGCCGMCKTGSGGGRDRRKTRHQDDYSQMPPTPYNGYQPSPAPMSYNRAASKNQFAQFDVSNKNAAVNEDALPAMPTWANAASRRVEDASEPPSRYAGGDVEMGRIAPSPRTTTTRGAYSQLPNNGPHSPLSPVPGQGQGQAYFANQQHPYQSDLSTQRLGQQEARYDDGFQGVMPTSPAPTYTTHPQPHTQSQPHMIPGTAVTTDELVSHAPTPTEYTRSQQQDQYFQPHNYNNGYQSQSQPQSHQQYGVISTSRVQSPTVSTRYEPSEYTNYRPQSISPPAHEQQYQQQYQQQYYHREPVQPVQPVQQVQPAQPVQQAARPPSLLQIGRKAVRNSQREI